MSVNDSSAEIVCNSYANSKLRIRLVIFSQGGPRRIKVGVNWYSD